MTRLTKKCGFTLVELLVSLLLMVVLFTVSSNFYNTVNGNNIYGLSGQVLQDGASVVLSKIIEGSTEATGIQRLAQGVSYCIGSGSSPSCSIVNPSELHFWNMTGVERWYKKSLDGSKLIFHHPTAAVPSGEDEIIYTAPDGATINLTFWIPTSGNYPSADVNINVALSRNVQGKIITGSATTLVNLRNHP